MEYLLAKIVSFFGDILIRIADFGSFYMCWAFLDEEELPKELQHSDFE
jgi:cyclic lactone autoinducer peptide